MNRWVRVAIMTGVVVTTAWIVNGFSAKPSEQAAPPPVAAPAAVPVAVPVAAVAPGRGLHFETPLMVLPVAADALTTVVDFSFTNDSGQAVTIDKVEKTCTCLAVEVSDSKLHYAPGEDGVIRATFALDNLIGEVEKTFHIYLKGDVLDHPTHTLTVRVQIPVLVKLSEKSLKWTRGGPAEPQRIEIEMAHTKPIRVVSTQSSSEGFKLELKTLSEGQRYELWVTPLSTAEPGLAVIRVETDCEIPRHRLQQVFAVIRNETPAREGAAK